MADMPLILHFILSAIATVGFSVFFQVPKDSLFPCGLIGGIGWTLYVYLFKVTDNGVFSAFIAASLLSLCSEILARKLKQPAILFVIPGIIPLVPGLGMYNTMLYLVQGDYNLGISTGTNTLFIAAAIALGVLVITSLSKTINLVELRKKRALNKH
ncbi:threonine/serine exporter family protein [Asaccharospora irregularis]|uniref:Uncharacterized membrane protein YjjB, DUF3815 family n=1 Tax=Asaccharospora irregularis DSM 2635 TaxID=1121321 RepID=A0A1M5J7K4_9FIRM|nr:threonine/serine exporter family protein [Asaccharospora irregularis]SHG36003.1 Uncharacterized membrane protein YjjB, DUF3815 family [Asaccharospora irregularis DSM 2635]